MPHDYQWISKNDPRVQVFYHDAISLLQYVHRDLKTYTFQHQIVGSYSRNMITYDLKSNEGFDLDFNIYPNDPGEILTAKDIKLHFKASLDKFGHFYGLDPAEDSTRVLTMKVKDRFSSRILHSVDFAFVNDYEENGIKRQQYIHYHKEALIPYYSWTLRSKGFLKEGKKLDWIKKAGLWDELFDCYINKKNHNTDPNYHSRSILAQAINDICTQNGYKG